MKKSILSVTTTALAVALTFLSCSKHDFIPCKDTGGCNFPVVLPGADVERVYTLGEKDHINVEMRKTYNPDGRVSTIGFYTFSAVSSEIYWHSFLLTYNTGDCTIDIIDSTSGDPVLKAMFSHSGRLDTLKRLQDETSDFANRIFEYEGGRLVRIFSRWKTFDDLETFTYDADGNIVRRETSDASGVTDASIFTYGASAGGRKQFYMPQYNYMIVADPSMALLEYLGWVNDFSPKNLLTRIEYLNPLPGEETFSGHDFDAVKLNSYSMGDYVGGRKFIDWR